MVTLYETERGDFAPAESLTLEEALQAFRRGHLVLTPEQAVAAFHGGLLLATDADALTAPAVNAVASAFVGFEVRIERGSIWGRRAGDDRHVIVVEGVQ